MSLKEQIIAVRDSGKTNMLDSRTVQYLSLIHISRLPGLRSRRCRMHNPIFCRRARCENLSLIHILKHLPISM